MYVPACHPRTARPDRRTLAALLAVATLLALAMVGPSTASAAPYSVWSCRGPDGTAIASGAWTAGRQGLAAGDAILTDSCASGGGLTAGLRPGLLHVQSAAAYTFNAPAGTTIVEYELWRVLRTGGLLPGYRAAVEGSAGPIETCDSALLGCATIGDGGTPLAAANRRAASGQSLSRLAIGGACRQAACLSVLTIAAEATLFRSRVVLDDPQAPTIESVGGSLTAPGTVSGSPTLQVIARDAGSGVASTTLSVDGGPATTLSTGGSCVQPYSGTQPCAARSDQTFTVATGGLSAGTHGVRGTVTDGAGNSTPWGPVSFVVGGGSKPPDDGPGNGRPAVRTPKLTITTSARRPTGTLTTASGDPIVGARLTLSRRTDAVARPTTSEIGTVTTDARGRFSGPRLPDGAYVVTAGFAPRVGGTATVSASVRARSALSLRLAAKPSRLRKGQTATVSGRLSGAGPSARGARVLIQTIIGGRWRTIDRTTANADGRWQWRHRFAKITRTTIFSFRATVARRSDWPWATETSAKTLVRVDPR